MGLKPSQSMQLYLLSRIERLVGYGELRLISNWGRFRQSQRRDGLLDTPEAQS